MDLHSRLAHVDYRRLSDGFETLNAGAMPQGGPLPKAVTDRWTPPPSGKVGSAITHWHDQHRVTESKARAMSEERNQRRHRTFRRLCRANAF